MLEITITDKEKVRVALNPDGPVDGIPVWHVEAGHSMVMPAADGMSAYLVSEDDVPGPGPSDTLYTVQADVDMGAGVLALTDQITLHVTEAQATTLGLAPSSPEPK